MKNNLKIIVKIIIIILIACFFLPVFTVSCAGTNIDVSAAHSMIGYKSQELGSLSDPQFILIALLLIPIVMLIVGGIKGNPSQTEVIVNSVLAVCEMVGYLLFRSGVKEYANKNMCNFSEGAGFYIVIILCVLVIIGYVGLLLVGAQSAVAVNKISTGNTKYNPTIKTNNLNPKIQGEDGWTCSCGKSNLEDSIFCARCGNKKPENVVDADSIGSWVCSCKNVMSNDNLFCSKCGSRKPEKDNMVIQEEIEQEEQQDSGWVCSCGNILNENALFCNKCGSRRPG